MMSQPKLNPHPIALQFQVGLRPVARTARRDVAVSTVLGVADVDVAPLGAED